MHTSTGYTQLAEGIPLTDYLASELTDPTTTDFTTLPTRRLLTADLLGVWPVDVDTALTRALVRRGIPDDRWVG